MVIDPSAPTKPEKPFGASAIENELPAYRAISALALVSLGLGVVSLLSFADLTFLVASVGAIVLGVLADWKIRRMPDILTGRGFAQAGVILGLIFGLSALTNDQVDRILLTRKIGQFADKYAAILKDEGVLEAFWYRQHPSVRAGKSPKQVEEMMLSSGRDSKAEFQSQIKQIQGIKDRLGPGGHLHRAVLESYGYDRLTPYGAIVLEMENAIAPNGPYESNDLLIEIKGEKAGREIKWWVTEIQPNYHRKTYRLRVKPVDDGHGHGH